MLHTTGLQNLLSSLFLPRGPTEHLLRLPVPSGSHPFQAQAVQRNQNCSRSRELLFMRAGVGSELYMQDK